MNGIRIFLGLSIISLGIIFIGLNASWWDASILLSVLALWPVFFIVLGLKFLIKNEKIFSIAVLILVALCALFIFTCYRSGNSFIAKDGKFMGFTVNNKTEQKEYSADFDEATTKKLSLTLNTGAAKVTLKEFPAAGNSEGKLYLVEAKNMGDITTTSKISNGEAAVSINESNVGSGFNVGSITDREIVIYLPESLPLDLDLQCGASKVSLDFSKLTTEKMDLNIGASSGDIYLGSKAANQTLQLDAGASSLVFHVPADLGISASFEGGLNNINSDAHLNIEKKDNLYQSSGFDTAASKLTITSSSGVSNFRFAAE